MFFVCSEINSYCTQEVELEPERGRRASGAMGGNHLRQWSRRGGGTATRRASRVIKNSGTNLWFDIGGDEADGTLASIISRK